MEAFRNNNFKTVCNIGFIGYGKHPTRENNKHSREYTIWVGMIQRCYSENEHKRSPWYIGCTVDERWHNFQNFCEDIQYLENYDKWINDNNKRNNYELDKDIKIKGNKIYSKDNCMFVTKKENLENAKRNLSGHVYEALRISDNYKEEFNNQAEFARKWDLCQANISRAIQTGGRTAGWRFEIKL